MPILFRLIRFTLYPQPSTVGEWFDLFQDSAIIGLLDFWGWELPMYATFSVVFLALYVLLRSVNQGSMAIALTPALLVSLPGALLLVVWFSLVGRRLLQLGRPEG